MAIEELQEIAPTARGVDVDGLDATELKRFAKAYQALDKAFANIQVYTDYSDEQLGADFPILFEEMEEYHGKYVNTLEKLRKDKEVEEDIEIDIEYELESVKTDEINYEYILQLIQAFLPIEDEEARKQQPTEKTGEEIDQYIARLKKSNPSLAGLMETLWKNIQADPQAYPQAYRNLHVSSLLEQMIQQAIDTLVEDFASKWCVQHDELAFIVANYNPNRERQNGEAELRAISDYEGYRASVADPVRKLGYWKAVRLAFEEMMVAGVLPLKDR